MDAAGVLGAVREIIGLSGGVVGVAGSHAVAGCCIEWHADERFPAASIIKVAILADLYGQADEGRLDLSERLPLREEDKVPGSGVLKELQPTHEFTLEELARLMIVISDNTASNLLIDRLTTGSINDRLTSIGMRRTHLGRKFFDYAARDRGLDNWANPGDLAAFMLLLEQRRLISPAASEAMLAILLRQQVSSKIPRLLPPETRVAHKTGTISDASHDAGIIYAPSGPIVLAVLTKGLSEADAEGVIRQISRAVYDAWGTA